MRLRSSKFGDLLAGALGLLVSLIARRAAAQACCAGAGAATPGRLSVHEDALVGLRTRAANVFGSFSADGSYVRAPAGYTEWDLEQDLFGAVRVAPRAQVAALVPMIQTYRTTPRDSDFGGGIGDVSLSGRYDLVLAGESRWVPGIAALVGITLPTGTAVESSGHPLATDATGTGAYQANAGLALEQTEGPWLLGVTALVAERAHRTVGDVTIALATQWTLLATTAYTFPNDAALALVLSYAAEGNAKENGSEVSGTIRRLPVVTLSGVYPFNDHLRLQGSGSVTLPFSGLGRNSPADAGFALTLVRSWF